LSSDQKVVYLLHYEWNVNGAEALQFGGTIDFGNKIHDGDLPQRNKGRSHNGMVQYMSLESESVLADSRDSIRFHYRFEHFIHLIQAKGKPIKNCKLAIEQIRKEASHNLATLPATLPENFCFNQSHISVNNGGSGAKQTVSTPMLVPNKKPTFDVFHSYRNRLI
jgi:hypothetical protein